MRKSFVLIMVVFLLLSLIQFVHIVTPSSQFAATALASGALLKVVNPVTGGDWLNFTEYDKNVGDTFIVNVTVADVERMAVWQFTLQWNSSLLECVNVSIPSDNIFAYFNSTDTPIVVGGPDLSHSGLVFYGATISYPGVLGFNGSGVLAQVEFKILQEGGQSELSFEGIGIDTFLLYGISLSDIPFTPINAHYSYNDPGLLGDVNYDGTVNMRDVMAAILAFNSFRDTPRWDSRADLDSNGHIDMRDINLVVLNFKHG